MIITTGDMTSDALIERARQLAKHIEVPFVERRKQSLPRMMKRLGDDQFIVLTDDEVRFTQVGKTDLFYHPSMAYLRIKRHLSGIEDVMIRAAKVQAGDTILDCTAGLGSDALVFAVAAGASGRVIACESELAMYALVREGLQTYTTELEVVNEAMRRIEMIHSNHLDLLKSLPDRSVDVVYFDPMFRKPVRTSAAIDPLRNVANHEALQEDVIEEAKRVARRSIVLKELKYSGEFKRLGFEETVQTGSKLAYGVIAIDNDK
ncbi:class I SAM-dependent methyltransferase [Paenibacillus sp. SC116]|uniref:class I SAM-dependent methyltransferase n=1 Tax=Paenibacillus sp. SC116 TaxID=2968986 RepID=UPI00215A4719|nr:class I SAM-dependent methyltransferase [Paenibacillus sp. SC116]MCR8842844.1 class I SAM-dependent methyltransferase [Paenibacillus sp. SC116]